MRNIIKLLVFTVIVICLCSCSANTVGNSSNNEISDGETIVDINLKKQTFVSYFNHDISYVEGVVCENLKSIVTEDGKTYTFKYPGEGYEYSTEEENEVLNVIHHMNGSLEMETPYETGEEIIVFYVTGKDGENYIKTRSPIKLSDVYTKRYPANAGENRFGDDITPKEYFCSFEDVISDTIEEIEDLKILTVEDAAFAVMEYNGQNREQFKEKETVDNQKYFHNEQEKIVYLPYIDLMVAPSESIGDIADVYNAEAYYFTVRSNSDFYYKVYLNGVVEQVNKNPLA